MQDLRSYEINILAPKYYKDEFRDRGFASIEMIDHILLKASLSIFHYPICEKASKRAYIHYFRYVVERPKSLTSVHP